MKRKSLAMSLISISIVGAAGYGMYRFGMQRGMCMAAAPAADAAAANVASDTAPQSIAQGEKPPENTSPPVSRPSILIQLPARRFSTTTTRWFRETSSTNPPSHRSWT